MTYLVSIGMLISLFVSVFHMSLIVLVNCGDTLIFTPAVSFLPCGCWVLTVSAPLRNLHFWPFLTFTVTRLAVWMWDLLLPLFIQSFMNIGLWEN